MGNVIDLITGAAQCGRVPHFPRQWLLEMAPICTREAIGQSRVHPAASVDWFQGHSLLRKDPQRP